MFQENNLLVLPNFKLSHLLVLGGTQDKEKSQNEMS